MKMVRIATPVLTCVMLATGLLAQTQTHSHDHSAPPPKSEGKQTGAKPGMMDDKKMMAHCMEMMQKRDRMQAEFKAMDTRMDDLMAKMNAAGDTDKREAMMAVITEMVAQHRSQRDRMVSMQADMMRHMMEHMQMGKQSMAMCPMMKEMQMSPNGLAAPEDHSQHHQP